MTTSTSHTYQQFAKAKFKSFKPLGKPFTQIDDLFLAFILFLKMTYDYVKLFSLIKGQILINEFCLLNILELVEKI